MDRILNIIKCVNCESTLSSPVLLPCGHSVCKKHASNESSIRCGKCGQDHSVPPNCFHENEAIAVLIETDIVFGETYHKAKQDCTHLGNLHDKIENLLKDPNFFIYEKINDLKNEVQIKR